MRKNSLFIYIAAYLALLIPTPGRFVYGFTLMMELFFLVLIGTLVISLVKKLQLAELKSSILFSILISFSILYRQIIASICPIVALNLGFIFYLPAVSLFMIQNVLRDEQLALSHRLKVNLINTVSFAGLGILFFLFRDIFCFGTITFFGKNHQISEKILLNPEKIGIFSFFATIPGALFISGILIFVHVTVNRKFTILGNAESNK